MHRDAACMNSMGVLCVILRKNVLFLASWRPGLGLIISLRCHQTGNVSSCFLSVSSSVSVGLDYISPSLSIGLSV